MAAAVRTRGSFRVTVQNDSLAFAQCGQIDALRPARERIQVSVIISNLDLVVLRDERHNDGLDTTSFASVFRAGFSLDKGSEGRFV